jgi:pyruvate dehydrogenase E2 component (dihydrolipoamide acetyltransferase)
MERSLTMPKLGMTMTEGTVLQWFYHEGDMIEKDEPLLEVMTDKVNIEVEAPFSGQLVRILAHDGETLPVGTPLAIIADTTEMTTTPATAPVSETGQAVAPGTPLPFHVLERPAPSSDARATSSTIVSETRVAAVAATPAARQEAAMHGVSLSAVLATGVVPPLHRSDVQTFVQRMRQEQRAAQSVKVTPLAQKIADEHNIDLAVIAGRKGNEPVSKVTRADVEALLAEQRLAPTIANASEVSQSGIQSAPPGVSVSPTQQEVTAAEYELIPLSPVRRIIGQRMQQSIITAPHIYLDTEIDMSEAERCRQQIARGLQAEGEAAPSLTALLLRAVATALLKHPEVNAALVEGVAPGKDAIKRWHVANIGVAVATEQALYTPVIRNAHRQTVSELSRSLRQVVQTARQGNLKPEDLADATFTVSNLGMYGIDTFHAIIPPGQSAILAVGKVTRRGQVVEDEHGERLEIRPMMKVSLSADHRVLDGASASRFLFTLKMLLETPYLLL